MYTYRVRDWYVYLGFVVFGLALKNNFNFFNLLLPPFLLSYAFSINDFFDNDVSRRYFVLPLIGSLVLLPFYSFYFIGVAALFLFAFTLYSVKPIRLKSVPYISTFVNGLGFSLLFLFGYGPFDFSDVFPITIFAMLTCFNIVAQLIHEICDAKEDAKNKINTTFARIGYKNTKATINLLLVLSIVLSFTAFLYRQNLFIPFVAVTMYNILILSDMKRIGRNSRIMFRKFGILVGIIYVISSLV